MSAAVANEAPDLLTVREAAARIGITDSAVRIAIQGNKLVPVVIGGRKFLRVVDVDKYKARHGRVPAVPPEEIAAVSSVMMEWRSRDRPSYLEEMQVKGQIFSEIAGNVAREARLAVQPVANPAQVRAILTLMLQKAVGTFMAEIGTDRLTRIAQAGVLSHEDVTAVFQAAHTTIERVAQQPMTDIDNATWDELVGIMTENLRKTGAMSIDGPAQGAQEAG